MAELNRAQFWKDNPNQMALPGMEEHAHPLAEALSHGMHVKTEFNDDYGAVPTVKTSLVHPGGWTVAQLNTVTEKTRGHPKGEIDWVGTDPAFRRRGYASALYRAGRGMTTIKPNHSGDRTPEGDKWARAVTAKYGGRVPNHNNLDLDDFYERD